MSARRALAAVWDFVVGDDWRLALASVLAIGATALAGAWWVAPLIALAALYWTLRGATPRTLVIDTKTSERSSGEDGGRGGRADTGG